MGFQKVVNVDPAIATPGLEVNPGQAVYTAFNFVSDGTVEAGGFAFSVALEEDEAGATAMNAASKKGSAGAKVLGFVERNMSGTILNALGTATNVYPVGAGVPIAIRGQFYAFAAAAATDGQSVLCDPTTGAITYGQAGAANGTGWVVRLPRGVYEVAEGDVVIYENFGLTVAAAAAGKSLVGTDEVGEAKAS